MEPVFLIVFFIQEFIFDFSNIIYMNRWKVDDPLLSFDGTLILVSPFVELYEEDKTERDMYQTLIVLN